ncbi:hypothetical protein RCL_jg4755.t1 [Rhizophagus clarus]|uniref:Uncharacterized protein n=1 Tax=Rhizophagus clarus TaxID=94130 RepID=A0A8H3R637_9GLOM|nr:hypothetical protein RCL_jg4755.t1 [Rhizophagus clarus]
MTCDHWFVMIHFDNCRLFDTQTPGNLDEPRIIGYFFGLKIQSLFLFCKQFRDKSVIKSWQDFFFWAAKWELTFFSILKIRMFFLGLFSFLAALLRKYRFAFVSASLHSEGLFQKELGTTVNYHFTH